MRPAEDMRRDVKYVAWGLVGFAVLVAGIVSAPVWLPLLGLHRLGRSFYTEVVKGERT